MLQGRSYLVWGLRTTLHEPLFGEHSFSGSGSNLILSGASGRLPEGAAGHRRLCFLRGPVRSLCLA